MGDISAINARKHAEGQRGIFRYTWEDVKELADHDGYAIGYCPKCGWLCIAAPGADAILEGYAQVDNDHHQTVCLDEILGLAR